MLNPLKEKKNTAHRQGETVTVTAGFRTITLVRSGGDYSQDWADALNAGKVRGDVAWRVDNTGNIRLTSVDVDTPFTRFMERAKRRILSPDEIRNTSFHWLNIAVEKGYMRCVGDRQYEVRPDRKINMEQAA